MIHRFLDHPLAIGCFEPHFFYQSAISELYYLDIRITFLKLIQHQLYIMLERSTDTVIDELIKA
jgi:hypothetical protein